MCCGGCGVPRSLSWLAVEGSLGQGPGVGPAGTCSLLLSLGEVSIGSWMEQDPDQEVWAGFIIHLLWPEGGGGYA